MNRQVREQQILDNAIKSFVQRGYSDITVSDLAQDAKVSRGTFYLYFKSKQEIFDCLIDRFMGEIIHFASIFDSKITKDQIQLSNISHDLSECLNKYRFLARFIIINEAELGTNHRVKLNAYIKQCYSILEYNINTGITLGTYKPVHIKTITRCLVGSIKELLLEWSYDNDFYDLEVSVSSLLDLIRSNLLIDFTDSNYDYQKDNDGIDHKDNYLHNNPTMNQ